MPGLVFKGDTVNNFGTYLPCPYVAKIKLTTDETYEISLSLFISMSEEQDVDSYLDELSDLNICVAFAADRDDLAEEVIEKQQNIFYFLSIEAEGDPSVPSDFGYTIINFTEFTNTDEILYDENNVRVVKLITQTSGFLGDLNILYGDWPAGQQWTNWSSLSDCTIFAFSTFFQTDEISTITSEVFNGERNLTLLNRSISDITYEPILENGSVIDQSKIVWLDKAGAPYAEIPIQSVSSQYYKAEPYTREDIVDSFETLIAEYGTLIGGGKNPRLENAIDSISYVLSTFAESAQLLPRLNWVAKAFPNKSASNVVGKLYKRFVKRIANNNTTIQRQGRLFKQLVISPKIIDSRGVTEEWTANEPEEIEDSDLIYGDWYISSRAFYMEGEDVAVAAGDYPGAVATSGFWFFDYEKLAHKVSKISQLFDVSKLEDFFGKEIINENLKVTNVELIRDPEASTGISAISTELNDTPYTSDITHDATSGVLGYASVTPFTGSEVYSYLLLRNFDIASNLNDLSDYRLMCFEFQDLYGWQLVEDDYTEPTGQEYEAQVYTEDNTLDIYTYLTEIYTSAYESFYEDYYTLADDTCSYNNTDSRFNQFFIDGIEATYVGNMAEAPWIQMPIVYNIHRDLLFNTFGGDMDLIFDNAKLLSQQISPRAGTLEALEGFKDIADEINDYYTSGDINDLFETLESDSSSEAYVLTFTDFPAVYSEEEDGEIADDASWTTWRVDYVDNWPEYALTVVQTSGDSSTELWAALSGATILDVIIGNFSDDRTDEVFTAPLVAALFESDWGTLSDYTDADSDVEPARAAIAELALGWWSVVSTMLAAEQDGMGLTDFGKAYASFLLNIWTNWVNNPDRAEDLSTIINDALGGELIIELENVGWGPIPWDGDLQDPRGS